MSSAIPSQRSEKFRNRNPQKKFLSENVIFWGLRLSLGPFGQQAPVSAPKWCINISSTSFHCGLIGILRLPKVQLVFSLGILEGVKWQTSRVA